MTQAVKGRRRRSRAGDPMANGSSSTPAGPSHEVQPDRAAPPAHEAHAEDGGVPAGGPGGTPEDAVLQVAAGSAPGGAAVLPAVPGDVSAHEDIVEGIPAGSGGNPLEGAPVSVPGVAAGDALVNVAEGLAQGAVVEVTGALAEGAPQGAVGDAPDGASGGSLGPPGCADPVQAQGLVKDPGAAVAVPLCKDQVWDMVFLPARTADGRTAEVAAIVDGYTRECLSVLVGERIAVEDIVDRLFDLFVLREVPRQIAVGPGAEPVSSALADWLRHLPVETLVCGPGTCGWEERAEPFAGRLRGELLGETSPTLEDLMALAVQWRRYYNETRPQYSPLEAEPQDAEFTGNAVRMEVEPAMGQTLPPDPGTADAVLGEEVVLEPVRLAEEVKVLEESGALEVDPVPAGPGTAEGGREAGGGWDTRMPRWLVVLARVGECAGIVLVFLLLALVVLALLAPHFGWRVDTVLSGSMEPELPVGCVQVTGPVNVGDIQPGDIITFRSPTNGALMSHRVVDVEGDGESYGFRTKGDANEDVDPYLIPAENVVGRYAFKVDHVGRAVEYLKTPLGFILLGLCGFALIAAEVSTMLEVRWREAARADSELK